MRCRCLRWRGQSQGSRRSVRSRGRDPAEQVGHEDRYAGPDRRRTEPAAGGLEGSGRQPGRAAQAQVPALFEGRDQGLLRARGVDPGDPFLRAAPRAANRRRRRSDVRRTLHPVAVPRRGDLSCLVRRRADLVAARNQRRCGEVGEPARGSAAGHDRCRGRDVRGVDGALARRGNLQRRRGRADGEQLQNPRAVPARRSPADPAGDPEGVARGRGEDQPAGARILRPHRRGPEGDG